MVVWFLVGGEGLLMGMLIFIVTHFFGFRLGFGFGFVVGVVWVKFLVGLLVLAGSFPDIFVYGRRLCCFLLCGVLEFQVKFLCLPGVRERER